MFYITPAAARFNTLGSTTVEISMFYITGETTPSADLSTTVEISMFYITL